MSFTETNTRLVCQQTGTEHQLSIAKPFRYDALDSMPLLLCLDGAWIAGAVRDATRIMSMSGEAPEALVAGLSFTDASMSGYLRSRARWYCPTAWVPPAIVGVKDVTAADTGHASTYLAFIRDQVLPTIRAEHPISQVWLVGHSFSALFGLTALFDEPELFDRYLLASPSIWWHDAVMFDIEATYADTHDDLPATVFMTAGELEEMAPFSMVENVVKMYERLSARGYDRLAVEHAVLPGETHSSAIGAAVSLGIRRLHAAS